MRSWLNYIVLLVALAFSFNVVATPALAYNSLDFDVVSITLNDADGLDTKASVVANTTAQYNLQALTYNPPTGKSRVLYVTPVSLVTKSMIYMPERGYTKVVFS